MIGRVLGCVALVGLSVPAVLDSALRCGGERPRLGLDFGLRLPLDPYIALLAANVSTWRETCCHQTLILGQTYTLALAVTALCAIDWRRVLVRINNVILLTELALYVFRDVWPLATYAGVPLDGKEGKILWAKVAVLVFTAVVVPLCIPKSYTPQEAKVTLLPEGAQRHY